MGLDYVDLYQLHRPDPLSHPAETAAAAFFAAAHAGTIPTAPERTYPLADVQQAHHDLESRNTTGPAVLLP